MSMHNDKHGDQCKDALSECVGMTSIVIGAKVHWSNAHEWAMSLKVKVLGSFRRKLDKIVMVFLDDILKYSKRRKSMRSI